MRLKFSLAAAYVGLAVLANWLASKYIVGVPFTPYMAPAGVFCIGFILCVRDWAQQLTSLRFTLLLVPIGGGVSYAVGVLAGFGSLQTIAVASFLAFCLSESAEAAVFTPIRKRNLALGVALSGTVGTAIDSFVFIWLAWSAIKFPGATHQQLFLGNTVGKLEMIAVGTALTAARRIYLPVRSVA